MRRALVVALAAVLIPGDRPLPETDPQLTHRVTLGDLLVNDPVVSMDDEDEFVAYVVSHLGEAPEIYATIREVNMGWHIPTHDEAMELEVGRNECALSE